MHILKAAFSKAGVGAGMSRWTVGLCRLATRFAHTAGTFPEEYLCPAEVTL